MLPETSYSTTTMEMDAMILSALCNISMETYTLPTHYDKTAPCESYYYSVCLTEGTGTGQCSNENRRCMMIIKKKCKQLIDSSRILSK